MELDGLRCSPFAAPNDPECGSHISQICKITVKDETSKVIFTEGYSYDKEGRISQIQQLDQRTDIQRDQLGRVSSITNSAVQGSDSDAPPLRMDETFQYDNFGRLLSSTDSGKFVYDDQSNQAIDGPRTIDKNDVSYRVDGKIMSVGSTTYSYNEMGLLSSVQSPSAKTDFAYSPEGDIVGITTNAGTIHFLGKSVRCFQSSCQLVLKEGPLIINRNAEVSSASIADGLGAPRLTVSQGADTAISRETYSAFGRPLSNSSVTTSARTGIGGQNFSPEAALYLLGARAFDPKNEVFLGPDPKQSFDNRMALTGKYVYGGGDPFSFENPQGQLLWFVPIIIGAILGATIAAVSGGN